MKENISIEMHEEIEVEAPMSFAFYDTDDTRYNVLKSLFDKQRAVLAEASGLDVDAPVERHIKAIKQKEKADILDTLAYASGIFSSRVEDHIAAIRHKASSIAYEAAEKDLFERIKESFSHDKS